MIKVLFVCLGNICRSPLAEAIFNHKIRLRHLDKLISAESAGTAHWHIGDAPDPRTLDVARNNGVPLEHSGRQISPADFNNYNYIVAMDGDNYTDLDKMASGKKSTAALLRMRQFDAEASGKDVPDPYYGSEEDFQDVFEILDESCTHFIDYLDQKHHLKGAS